MPAPNTNGFLPNPFDARDVWADEILAGNVPIPSSYRTEGLKFEPQGSYPFCVSFATTKAIEYALNNKIALSQPWLFFNSGGTENGSWFRSNLDTALRGNQEYSKLPMPEYLGDRSEFYSLKEAAKLPPDESKRILGYVRVSPTREALQRAIMASGMVITGVAASGGYWADKAKRPPKDDDHAVLLVGWDEDGSWWVFDSLQPSQNFDGYHRLAPDYEFRSCYAITELPADWKEQVAEVRKAPPGNAERYGKPRDYAAEVAFAAKMLAEFKKFNNQSVLEAAGRFWEMYVRAGVYGGYSLSYTKWMKWHPGDLINDCYMWRRTGQHIFDFNKSRSEYK